jgi:hypothetical protein
MSETIFNVAELLEACKAFGLGLDEWRARRQFISAQITRDGPFLDLGCGSGYLIFCLRLWSGRDLTPYGVDLDANAIQLARGLFPQFPDNFLHRDYSRVVCFPPRNWPAFEYVFWNAPNAWNATRCAAFITAIVPLASSTGSVIIAQYGQSASHATCAEIEEERAFQRSRWKDIAEAGVTVDQIVWNGTDAPQCLGVIRPADSLIELR